jgi:hypothetical protein
VNYFISILKMWQMVIFVRHICGKWKSSLGHRCSKVYQIICEINSASLNLFLLRICWILENVPELRGCFCEQNTNASSRNACFWKYFYILKMTSEYFLPSLCTSVWPLQKCLSTILRFGLWEHFWSFCRYLHIQNSTILQYLW